MSKNIIRDFIPFTYDRASLMEAKSPDGILRVTGTLQRANSKNQNGRVYPREILEREINRYIKEFVEQNRALGELDHPESAEVNLAKASHNITKIWWEGDDVKGTLEILPTPCGNILKNLLLSGIRIGISSRGVGTVKEVFTEDRERIQSVQDDFELNAFDVVSNPSTQYAFVDPIKESVSSNIKPVREDKIGKIVSDIVCDIRGVCSCNKAS